MHKCFVLCRSLTARILIAALTSQEAYAFMDPPALVTLNPAPGQQVMISINVGDCDAILADPPPTITQTGNDILMVVPTIHSISSDFCIYPTGVVTFVVGSFTAGSYSLQVDRTYIGDSGPVTVPLGTLAFIVAAPQSAPALSLSSLFLLAMVLLAATRSAFRHRGFHSALLLACLIPLGLRAQTPSAPLYLEVLLSAKQGTPTPDAVIAYFGVGSTKSGPAPLQSLAVENPQSASYLLPVRAKGDFLAILNQYPNWSRAKLERYVLIQYPQTANLQNAISAFKNDPSVDAVYLPATMANFSSATLSSFSVDSGPIMSNGAQYGRDDLNIDAAWKVAGGYALVGDVNNGLDKSHPALMQFSANGQYLGGNFVPASSLNIGFANTPGYLPSWSSPDVDELFPIPNPPTHCSSNNVPSAAGHGTHVAGLIAANPVNSFGVYGTCKFCGLAALKMTYPACVFSSGKYIEVMTFIPSNFGAGIDILADSGAQVINLSFGDEDPAKATGTYCANNPTYSWCTALTHATYRDATVVASAGNNRSSIQFPANDNRVLVAGGVQQNLAIWDLYPNCPSNPPETTTNPQAECGSGYQTPTGYPPQEVMAAANQVLSTTYPNYNWNPNIYCGDQFPGPGWGGGAGWCTGTSMSAPQISGVVGILRSINPLVYTGGPTSQPLGIRAVLARTTFEVQGNSSFYTSTLGYGHPDAGAAARKMLGAVAGRQVLNRVTPLFRLYSSVAQDHADTTSPQFATALMLNQTNNYQTQGDPTPGYSSFPSTGPGGPTLPAPLAKVYVMTTEYTPQIGYPPLVPLYLMQKVFTNSSQIDFMLVNNATDIQLAYNNGNINGYSLRTIQGYVYQACTPEPTCIPPGAQKLYRKCNSVGDCATFLESEATNFASYTSVYPAGSNPLLGYAYPNVDSDSDGLVDGMEYVIGTNPLNAHSGGGSPLDGTTYPQAGVPVGDPCLGAGAINCPANFIFKNGFGPAPNYQ